MHKLYAALKGIGFEVEIVCRCNIEMYKGNYSYDWYQDISYGDGTENAVGFGNGRVPYETKIDFNRDGDGGSYGIKLCY